MNDRMFEFVNKKIQFIFCDKRCGLFMGNFISLPVTKIPMITLPVLKNDGLKAKGSLEQKKQIKILDEFTFNSHSLPGQPLSLEAFRNLIFEAENSPTISLKEFERRQSVRKRKLLKLVRSTSRKRK